MIRTRSGSRRGTVAVAVAGSVAGLASLGAVMRRRRRRPEAHSGDDFGELPGSLHRIVPTTDGGEIHVVDRGHGRPFVLLPGVTLTTLSWQYQLIDLVEAGYRVLALDIRGHGRSIAGRDGYSLARLAADVHEVLIALDVRDAIVVGHSLGGMTALELLVDHAEVARDGTVSGVVLVSTSASMVIGNGVPAVLARVAGVVTPAAGRGHVFASAQTLPRLGIGLANLYCRLAFGAAPSPTHIEVVRAMTSAVPSEVLSPLIVTLMTMDVRRLLPDISVPALVVVGRRDLITPIWHSRHLASNIPAAELVVLPGCGHLVLFERRPELAELLIGCAHRWPGDRSAQTLDHSYEGVIRDPDASGEATVRACPGKPRETRTLQGGTGPPRRADLP